jgi:aspartate 1-decarboxylase
MLRKVLHSKLHQAVCTAALPDYVGSITIDEDLLDAVGMRVNDAVLVANCRNGERFETYIFKGERGSRRVEVNGAAAHFCEPGDKLIILHFCLLDEREAATHRPRVAIIGANNEIVRTLEYESPGAP